jgi:hypothetical protein
MGGNVLDEVLATSVVQHLGVQSAGLLKVNYDRGGKFA